MIKQLKIFQISQNINTTYDSYFSAIICATDEKQALYTHPNAEHIWNNQTQKWHAKTKDIYPQILNEDDNIFDWCNPKHITVQEIGICTNKKLKNHNIIETGYRSG